jgi:hypothetical protein
MPVDAIAEKLDTKLSQWKPEVSQELLALVAQVIDAADNDALDLVRSRAIDQEVLDQLNDSESRSSVTGRARVGCKHLIVILSRCRGGSHRPNETKLSRGCQERG